MIDQKKYQIDRLKRRKTSLLIIILLSILLLIVQYNNGEIRLISLLLFLFPYKYTVGPKLYEDYKNRRLSKYVILFQLFMVIFSFIYADVGDDILSDQLRNLPFLIIFLLTAFYLDWTHLKKDIAPNGFFYFIIVVSLGLAYNFINSLIYGHLPDFGIIIFSIITIAISTFLYRRFPTIKY
jgi:hypothetical protein